MVTVLVLGDSPDTTLFLCSYLSQNGCKVAPPISLEEGVAGISVHRPDVLLLRIDCHLRDCHAAVTRIAKAGRGKPMMVLTDHVIGHPETLGIAGVEVIPKHLPLEEVKRKIHHLAANAPVTTPFPPSNGIVGRSTVLREVLEQAQMAARTPHHVLITGESGTGKELFARYVHDNSHRKDKPFVTVNCAALGETLFHAEMFGYRKGSFTGADTTRSGYLREAEGGSLFLDEIGEIPLHSQVKLLRVLERGEYNPVGDPHAHQTDVRIITATNRDIAAEVQRGRFRLDLYYRLNVFHIPLPPLRERVEEIPLLAGHFIRLHSAAGNGHVKGVARDALEKLIAYPWPGNVRELENMVIRALAHSHEPLLTMRDFSLPSHTVPANENGTGKPNDVNEREKLVHALKTAKGDVKEVAEILVMNRATLYRKIRKHQINISEFRSQQNLL